MRRLAFAVLSLTVLVACQPATTELTDAEKVAIADEFRQFRMDLYASNERNDVESTLNAVSEDVALITQGIRLSYADFATAARDAFGSLQAQTVNVQDMQIDVLAAGALVNTDAIVTVTTDTSGNTVEQTHLHTEVWVKRDGRWVMTHGHKSNPPG
jgi:hypothetical protein